MVAQSNIVSQLSLFTARYARSQCCVLHV